MNVTQFVVGRLGADYRQWQSLTKVMHKDQWCLPILGAINATSVLYGLIGVLFAGLAFRLPTISEAGTLVLSVFMVSIFLILLAEHSTLGRRNGGDRGDWELLRCFPVSERTFFLSHLTILLRRTQSIVFFIAAPALLLTFGREGALPAIGWAAALALSSIFIAFFLATLFEFWEACHSRRWIVQGGLLVGAVVFGAALAGPTFAIEPDGAQGVLNWPPSRVPFFPPTWFSALVHIANGAYNAGAVLLVAVAVAATLGAFLAMQRTWAYGQASLQAGHRLGRNDAAVRLELVESAYGRLPSEARICASLFLAHLRRDANFRMRLLADLPVGLIALSLSVLGFFGVEAVADRLDAFTSIGLIHLVAVFVPLAWLDTTRRGNAYRAMWIFASTSVDRGKILFWSGALVGIFALPFLIVVGVVLFLLLGGGWRAIGHATNLILVIYVAFNVMLVIRPQLPFSMPTTRRRVVSGVDLAWGFLAFFLPILLSAAMSSLWSAVGFAAVLLVAVARLRQLVVKRGRDQLDVMRLD